MHLLSRHIARVSTLTVALVAVTACGGESSTPPSVGGTGSGGTGSAPPPPPPPPPPTGAHGNGIQTAPLRHRPARHVSRLKYARPPTPLPAPTHSKGPHR